MIIQILRRSSIEEYNPGKWRTVLRVFDDVIADLIINKKNLSNTNWTIFKIKKTKHFSYLLYTVIFRSA